MIRSSSVVLASLSAISLWCLASDPALVASEPASAAPSQATAYQGNAFHDGAASGSSLAPPLSLHWSTDLGGRVSYPLIVDGRIYVTVGNNSAYGTVLHALDARTGQSLWTKPVSGTYYWSAATYDSGNVFVLSFDGVLRAFDAIAGTLLWRKQMPGQYAFSSAPTAVDGVVYVGGAGIGGTVYAVDEVTATVLWTQGVANGDESSPVVTDQSVFVSYACPQTYALDRATGNLQWHYSGGCSGGGGKTVVYHRGRVYVRDVFFGPENGMVFDSGDGTQLGTFKSAPAPAFDRDRGYFLFSGTLTCRNVVTGQSRWTFAGDGALSTAPIVANGSVYMGTTAGNLYALDASTGVQQWSTNVGTAIYGPDEQNVSQPLTGMGASGRYLVVPAGTRLLVYGN